MKPKALFYLFILLGFHSLNAQIILWPTKNQSFFKGLQPEEFLQVTESGKAGSGGFGCVRNEGKRFHEGLDIKATKRDKKREALDNIIAVLPGEIVHVNSIAGNSSYGRYIVIEHKNLKPSIYTLYAHLKSIDSQIKIGQKVQAGEKIGIMGRSAMGYHIPKQRAHLHFEMGLMISNKFQRWYDDKKFENPNKHGRWNGMNLSGFDPLDFYKKTQNGHMQGIKQYLQALPIACKVRVLNRKVPDFLKRYPTLLSESINPKDLVGWDIDFTWFGLPVKWKPLKENQLNNEKQGDVILLAYNEALIKENPGKQLLVLKEGKPAKFSKTLKNTLNLLFKYL